MAINISNARNRDAVVALESLNERREVYYVDAKGNPVQNRRVLKSDTTHDLPELTKKVKKIEKVAKALIDGDPEVDIESFGRILTDTSRVYVNERGIVHFVEEFEIIKDPDGTIREKRPRKKLLQNMNSEFPLRWTGKLIKKSDAITRFVFTNKKQLVHINGLTFEFLLEMAKELAKKDSLLLLRGGAEGKDPLVMHRGGKQYNAFLEGRVKGNTYCLILHLSNMELRTPKDGTEK